MRGSRCNNSPCPTIQALILVGLLRYLPCFKAHREPSSKLPAFLGVQVASELAFRLPLAHTAAFPALFHDLDAAVAAERGIAGYGVSVTTLEEVFLRIARGEAQCNEDGEEEGTNGGERGDEGQDEASHSGEGDAERGGAKEGQPGRPGPTLSKVGTQCGKGRLHCCWLRLAGSCCFATHLPAHQGSVCRSTLPRVPLARRCCVKLSPPARKFVRIPKAIRTYLSR